jgi:hypothetical protein
MPKQYHVQLTDDERAELRAMTRKGPIAARKLVRPQALLHADAGQTDEESVAALQIGTDTVGRLRDEWWLMWRVWLGRRSERERELALVARHGSHVTLHVLRSRDAIRALLERA